ncbi:MAG: NAD-binding protein [Alphaproteobacteria bacterium]|nr:NAD-binding protein [Alphaproteobacteria bacterium]
MREIETVGLVGLGKMGGPMARHIAGRGYAVLGTDAAPARTAEARGAGLRTVESCAALAAESDLVLVAVGFDSEVEQAVLGADGLLAGAREGTIIAIASTVAPRTMTRLLRQAGDAPVHFLDCPLTRGEQAAIDGRMLTMVGGDEAVFQACRPVMESYADSIFHLGALGAGQVGKMVNNLILWACMSANREGLMLGRALGVEPETLRDALLASSAQNWCMETRADEHPTPWAEKDMMIVLAEADRLRLPLPLCGVVKEVIKQLKIERGYPTPAAAGD